MFFWSPEFSGDGKNVFFGLYNFLAWEKTFFWTLEFSGDGENSFLAL
jgi:hypothetical protein